MTVLSSNQCAVSPGLEFLSASLPRTSVLGYYFAPAELTAPGLPFLRRRNIASNTTSYSRHLSRTQTEAQRAVMLKPRTAVLGSRTAEGAVPTETCRAGQPRA